MKSTQKPLLKGRSNKQRKGDPVPKSPLDKVVHFFPKASPKELLPFVVRLKEIELNKYKTNLSFATDMTLIFATVLMAFMLGPAYAALLLYVCNSIAKKKKKPLD